MDRWWSRLVITIFVFMSTSATEVPAIGLPENWERTVLFIEYKRLAGKPCLPKEKFDSPDEEQTAPEYCAVGTGFAMKICGHSLLFSNRHVLALRSSLPLSVRMKSNTGEFIRLEIGEWRGHKDARTDIAGSFLTLPKGKNSEDYEEFFKFFDEDKDRKEKQPESFLVKLEDLRVGDEVLLGGYPSSIPGIFQILQTHDAPIFRGGIVSLKLPGVTRLKFREGRSAVEKDLKDIFLIDAWSFPGNSGSPVFLLPTTRYGNDRAHIRLNRPYIVGIQGATMEGTGLSIVYAASGIEETAAQFPGAQCPPPVPSKREDK